MTTMSADMKQPAPGEPLSRSRISKSTLKRLGIALVAFTIPVSLFLGIADEIREGDSLFFDTSLLYAIHTLSNPILDTFFLAATDAGGVVGVSVISAVSIGLFYRYGHRRQAALYAFAVGGAAIINLLLKTVFQRMRPDLWAQLVTEKSFSFPSGHAMASSAVAFSMMVIFWPTRWRWYAVTIAGFYMLAVSLSRLYLGVHYPSDVLGGWLVSAAWILVVKYVMDIVPHHAHGDEGDTKRRAVKSDG